MFWLNFPNNVILDENMTSNGQRILLVLFLRGISILITLNKNLNNLGWQESGETRRLEYWSQIIKYDGVEWRWAG